MRNRVEQHNAELMKVILFIMLCSLTGAVLVKNGVERLFPYRDLTEDGRKFFYGLGGMFGVTIGMICAAIRGVYDVYQYLANDKEKHQVESHCVPKATFQERLEKIDYDMDELPGEFIDAATLSIMNDPVVLITKNAKKGITDTVDRATADNILNIGNRISPTTSEKITEYVSNTKLKLVINRFVEEQERKFRQSQKAHDESKSVSLIHQQPGLFFKSSNKNAYDIRNNNPICFKDHK